MKILSAPWRFSYVTKSHVHSSECPFCGAFAQDKTPYVLWNDNDIAILLNLYPYNTGHLLVVPKAHVGLLHEIDPQTNAALWQAVRRATKIVQEAFKADGINIGVNLGQGTGGSIPEHLHVHILPRWLGDTSFLPVFADVKVASTNLDEVFEILTPLFIDFGERS